MNFFSKQVDFFGKNAYTTSRIIKHENVFVRAALRRRSIFLLKGIKAGS